MADIILHIKDAYHFEVPKALWRKNFQSIDEVPDWLIRLDDDFQGAEANAIIEYLDQANVPNNRLSPLKADWKAWQKTRNHEGWPLDAFLDQQIRDIDSHAQRWSQQNKLGASDVVKAYMSQNHSRENYAWFYDYVTSERGRDNWNNIRASVNSKDFIEDYKANDSSAKWGRDKLDMYSGAMDGKVMIPQYFGEIRNAYEPKSGLCISKYMIVEVIVAIVVLFLMRWLATKIVSGNAPKGKLWNAMEGMLLFVRNQVIVPAMGEEDGKRFLPLLWTFFVFIFGLNLAGMIPWVGAPTASLAVAGTFALVVFLVVVSMGIKTFGVLGYLKNIMPKLGLPWYLAFWVVPLIWVIEFASLFIKHSILALRLLANMVAGHAVLLGIMGLAVGLHAYAMSSGVWYSLAGASAVGMVALSVLELFVAFLQAAVFTFLAAMFIGSSLHHH